MHKQNDDWKRKNKSGMVLTNWVKADNELIRYIISETDAQTCMLYIIILSHRYTKNNQCYPSISLLAKEMDVSGRTIQRMINRLHEIGVLKINSGKMGVANNYYFPEEEFYKEDPTSAMAHKRKTAFRKKPSSKKEPLEEDIVAMEELDETKKQDDDWDDDFPF